MELNDLARIIKLNCQAITGMIPPDFFGTAPVSVTETRPPSSQGRRFFSMPVAKDFGVFATIIRDAELQGYYECLDDGRTWVYLKLGYRHPGGGSNNSGIATLWIAPDGELTISRPGRAEN